MITTFKDNKVYFEKKFFDNWIETPIQPVGEDWSAKTIDAWINPFYSPSSGSLAGFGTDSSKLNGTLSVVCWAKTDYKVMDLADKLIEFVGNKVNPNLFNIQSFEIADHAWNETNFVFMYIIFNVESYSGVC